jgi:transcription initiation factor TFIIE subunit alpha
MKLSNKIIEEVVTQVAGPDVMDLVKLLKNKKNISEFKLAESLEEEVNIVRNKLYRLYHANLVSFTRRKDKKKGWYIYYWTFKPKQIKFVLVNLKKQKLEKLKDRLEREKDSYFFICKDSCMRLDFEKAIGFEFKCPECGELMQQESNTQKIKQIEEEILQLEKEVVTT